MSQVFYPWWETVDLWFLSTGSYRTSNLFPTWLWTMPELLSVDTSSNFVFKSVLKPIFFKVSFQTSFTLQIVAEHVSSFPSAVEDHRLAIFIYGYLQNQRFVPNLSVNNRRSCLQTQVRDFVYKFCIKPCGKCLWNSIKFLSFVKIMSRDFSKITRKEVV